MGDWTVIVSGTGSHHNGLAGDADRLAQHFVDDLIEAQQSIRMAVVTVGGLGVLDTVTAERERYQASLEASYRRDPQRFPYESIAEKLAAYDEQQYAKLGHMSALNLLPGNLAKSYTDQRNARHETVSWRYEPGGMRHRSVDGGKTWEPAPERSDVITALFALRALHEDERAAAVTEGEMSDHDIALVAGNRSGVVSRLVDMLGIRSEWEDAQSDPGAHDAAAMKLLRTVASESDHPSWARARKLADVGTWPTKAELNDATVTLTSDGVDTQTTAYGETLDRAQRPRVTKPRSGSTEASDQA